MKYILIIAPTAHDLPLRVNKFLQDRDEAARKAGTYVNQQWPEFVGPAQVLGYEAFAQTLCLFEEDPI